VRSERDPALVNSTKYFKSKRQLEVLRQRNDVQGIGLDLAADWVGKTSKTPALNQGPHIFFVFNVIFGSERELTLYKLLDGGQSLLPINNLTTLAAGIRIILRIDN
jgi:hypothetical protein